MPNVINLIELAMCVSINDNSVDRMYLEKGNNYISKDNNILHITVDTNAFDVVSKLIRSYLDLNETESLIYKLALELNTSIIRNETVKSIVSNKIVPVSKLSETMYAFENTAFINFCIDNTNLSLRTIGRAFNVLLHKSIFIYKEGSIKYFHVNEKLNISNVKDINDIVIHINKKF